MVRSMVLTLYDDPKPSSGCSLACRLPLHTCNTSRKTIRSARLRHCAVVALSKQSVASACLAVHPVPLQRLEAGMMNPQQLWRVPAPLLRSVILATGVVGLLAAFGPAGSQNTGVAPREAVSAPSLATEQELAGAPQPTAMFHDDLGQTDVAIVELPLAGAVADTSSASNKPEPVVETASANSPDVSPTEPAPVQVAMARPSQAASRRRATGHIMAEAPVVVMDMGWRPIS